jgi:hypothetical protein
LSNLPRPSQHSDYRNLTLPEESLIKIHAYGHEPP